MATMAAVPTASAPAAAPAASIPRSFTLMTWNVLARGLAEEGGFLDAHGAPLDPALLDSDARTARALAHILAVAPDILALQECSCFDTHWRQPLMDAGYLFLRIERQDSAATRAGHPRYGLVLAARTDVFRQPVCVKTVGDATALVADLTMVAAPAITIRVTVVHLKSGPPNGMQRVRQVIEILGEFPEDEKHQESIIMGDFNEQLSDRGAAYSLRDWTRSAAVTSEYTTLKRRVRSGVPEDKRAAIDHIMYNKYVFRLAGLPRNTPMLTCDDRLLPSADVPSDHLPVCCAIAFKV